MIKKKQRQELYDKFRQGGTPSGADFADLIKSQLNLLDDGIDISEDPNEPVCLKSHGPAENILDFANQDGVKRWRISGCSEAASTEGLNIQADERSKIYIERETGNVGINTDQPAARLHIIQTGSDDAFRVDDVGNDETPFVITSDGQVGIGTGLGAERPKAKLHISYDGAGDVLRVDDTSGDKTPFIINEQGKVGIGCSLPNTNLTVVGGVSICSEASLASNESIPTGNSLYVEGNITVGGNVVFSGGEDLGGIEINAPLRSKTNEVVIQDNLKITGDGKPDSSRGDLTVAGNTFLGTYNEVKENRNVVTINGRIESGGVSEHGIEQYELEINETLTVSRDPNGREAIVHGDLTVAGATILGESATDEIQLNGKVSTNDVTINDNLLVKGTTTLGDSSSDNIYVNGTVSSNTGALNIADSVNIGDNLNINGFLAFDNSNININGIVTTVGNDSDHTIPTEKAVKNFMVNNLPAGLITIWPLNTPPVGWLECNGASISSQTFSALFAAIGTTYGRGDGENTFRIPDYRGYFLRGWDHGTGRDPDANSRSARGDGMSGNNVGTKQDDAFQAHRHQLPQSLGYRGGSTDEIGKANKNFSYIDKTKGAIEDGNNGTPRTASETRPLNIYSMFIIKY